MSERFDALMIGAGQSGPFLAARLADKGMKVALVERRRLGGTCVNDGCIPTKTLVASARAAHVARRAADYGVVLDGDVKVDMKRVKARKDAIVSESVGNLEKWLGGMPSLTLIHGHARFAGPDSIEVDGRTLSAPQIFVNVGARATVPDWPGLSDGPFLTNSSMMALDVLPEHLVIVGGSYIGLEFAQMYRRFGAAVTVIEHGPRIVSREDPEVSATLQQILEGEGIRFVTGATDFRVSHQGSRVALTLQAAGQPLTVEGSHLLIAIGRRPNTDDLGLDRAGLSTDAHGYIEVDDQLRTRVPGIWAIGDCNGRGAFTHTSYNDYEIVAANLLDDDPRKVSDRIMAYALYTDPPLARIGLSETQVRQSGLDALIGTLPMTRVGRARERGETQGFMKVLVDARSHRILGATLLCIEADEVIHSLLDVMAADAPYTVIQRCMHIHPTVSELVPTLLGQLQPLR